MGKGALKTVTTANNSTAIGNSALEQNSSGAQNTATGMGASNANTTGSYNTSHGYGALYATNTGNNNTGLGGNAGDNITTGSNNTVIGYNADASSATVSNEITLGDANITKFRVPGLNFIIKDSTATEDYVLTVDASGEAGWEAAGGGGASEINDLSDGVTTTNSVGLGSGALAAITGTPNVVAVGKDALKSNTSGTNNVAVGKESLKSNVTANNNTAVGHGAFEQNTGSQNVAVGGGSANANTTASYVSAVGYGALSANTTGNNNTGLGGNAGNNLTTGSNNTVIGYNADASSATVSNEITLGDTNITKFRVPGLNFIIKDSTATDNYVLTVDSNGEAGWEAAAGGATEIDGLSDAKKLNTSTYGIGATALNAMSASDDDGNNLAVGYQAGGNLDAVSSNKPFQNTFIGANAGYGGTQTGGTSGNVAIGFRAFQLHTGSLNNVIIGKDSGAVITTGSQNVAVGRDAAKALTTGGTITAIGDSAGSTATTGTNNTIIGNSAAPSSVTVSNEITLGNGNISSLRCQVTSISSLSDRRDKKDIKELPIGLNFINKLNPVEFTWNMRDGAKVGQKEAGFIAQELDEAQQDAGVEDLMKLVLKTNPDKLEAAPGKLIPVLVKAIQELSSEIQTLKGNCKCQTK